MLIGGDDVESSELVKIAPEFWCRAVLGVRLPRSGEVMWGRLGVTEWGAADSVALGESVAVTSGRL